MFEELEILGRFIFWQFAMIPFAMNLMECIDRVNASASSRMMHSTLHTASFQTKVNRSGEYPHFVEMVEREVGNTLIFKAAFYGKIGTGRHWRTFLSGHSMNS